MKYYFTWVGKKGNPYLSETRRKRDRSRRPVTLGFREKDVTVPETWSWGLGAPQVVGRSTQGHQADS